VWIIALPLAALVAIGVAVVVLREPLEKAWLLHRLESSDEEVAAAAAEALIELGELRALPVLARRDAGAEAVLWARKEWLERWWQRLGEARKTASSEGVWTLRAVAALGDHAEKSVPALVALLDDDDPAVRFAALLAIDQVVDAGASVLATSTAFELFAHEDLAVRRGAAELLGRLPRIDVDVAHVALRTVVQQGDQLQRVDELLRSWPRNDDPMALLESWLDDEGMARAVIDAMATVLCARGDVALFGIEPEAWRPLLQALEHRSPTVRQAVLAELIEPSSTVDLDSFIAQSEVPWKRVTELAVSDPDPAVRTAAGKTLETWLDVHDKRLPPFCRDSAWRLLESASASLCCTGLRILWSRGELEAADVRRLLPLTRHDDLKTRARAVSMIAAASRVWIESPEATAELAPHVLPLLIEWLGDEDVRSTATATNALRWIGPAARARVEPLISSLVTERPAHERLLAISHRHLPVAPVASMLAGDDPRARGTALRLIRERGPYVAALRPAVAAALEAQLRQRSGGTTAAGDITEDALWALGRLGPSRPGDSGGGALEPRELFLRALELSDGALSDAALANFAATEPRLDDAQRVRLVRVWDRRTFDRRNEAALALLELGVVRRDVVDTLITTARAGLFVSGGRAFSASEIEAPLEPLAAPGLPAAWIVPHLREWIVDECVQDRDACDCGFGCEFGGEWGPAAAPLLETLGPDGRDAAPALAALIAHPACDGRSDACRALGSVDADGTTALPALTAALRDPQTRLAALDGLLCLGPGAAPAVDAVLAYLDDVDPAVRERGVELIGSIAPQSKDVALALVRRLGDTRWFVRQRAAWALGELGDRASGAIDALRARLDDADARVAWQARKALVRVAEGRTP